MNVVGLVRTMRELARWAGADIVVRQWDHALPRAAVSIASIVAGALLANLMALFSFVAVGAALAARVFGADLLVTGSLPPPPAPPSPPASSGPSPGEWTAR